MEAIYAIDSNYGLSKEGKIAWESKKDMLFFKNKTINNIVIMGKNTYFSLPKKHRPLKNRLNIVLTNNPEKYSHETINLQNIIFVKNDKIYQVIFNDRKKYLRLYPFLTSEFKIYIIGGKDIYEQFIPLCKCVWMTKLKSSYSCDLFFNYDFSKQFEEPEIIDDNDELIIYKYNNKYTI
jgi:dihydrofolate reductase